jgi:two-component system sensor histidine kinase CpxA
VTNAHRYGGQKVWTEIYETARRVVIAVVDDGEGVPEESIEEIFRPYGRASVGIANPSSVGLGLSVSLQLARLMGGDLGYKRIDGTTRFEVSLPKAPATAEARAG